MTIGVVLAGSHVWRDDCLECLCPRPLLPVANALLIDHALNALHAAGVRDAVICSNELAAPIRRVLGDGSGHGLDLRYLEDRMPRGPAGCVRDAMTIMDADRCIVIDASVIPALDLGGLLEDSRTRQATATVVVNPDASEHAHLGGRLTPAGVYVFERAAFDGVPECGYHDIKEILIPRLRRKGAKVAAHVSTETSPRVTGLESYLAVHGWAIQRMLRSPDAAPGYSREGGVLTHETADVQRGARLLGPVMIGPGASVASSAILIGPCVLGAGARVEADGIVTRSVLWRGAVAEANTQVDECVVTDGAVVGRGAVRQGVVCHSRWAGAISA